jgi:hypothetical protein
VVAFFRDLLSRGMHFFNYFVIDNFVVDVVPILPGQVLHVNADLVQPALALDDLDAAARRPRSCPIFGRLPSG